MCPECNIELIQQTDKWRFKCRNGHTFVLVKLGNACASCGKVCMDLLPNGLCRKCAKKLGKEVK